MSGLRRAWRLFIDVIEGTGESLNAPCLNHPSCALVLGHQWCTCHSPALSNAETPRPIPKD